MDHIPIRVFKNYERKSVPYPNKQAMRIYTSLWNADNWATRGGLDKIDWIGSPFTAKMRLFRARACPWIGASSITQCAAVSPANWWTAPIFKQLSTNQLREMTRIRGSNIIYDYCRDVKRFNGNSPIECSLSQY